MSLDALDNLARQYPGGIAALAVRMNKHPGTLRSELQPPPGSTAKLGYVDAIRIMSMCRQVGMPAALTPLDMVEESFDRVAIAMPRGNVEHGELAKCLAEASQEFAALMGEVAQDLEDSRISDNELKRIRAKGQALMGGIGELLRVVGEMNAASKPATYRQGVVA